MARIALLVSSSAFALTLVQPAHAQQQGQKPQDGVLRPGTMAARVAACTACHGVQGRAGTDGYYPRLAGKPQAYLYQQLLHFRDGQRRYRPMSHLLAGLPDAYLNDIAAYFSTQAAPYPQPLRTSASATMLERGRVLAMAGDAQRRVPACVACHGQALSGVLPGIPGLLGLPHDYIASQLGSWQGGLRHSQAPDCMADVARALSPDDLAAVSAWLSSRPVAEPYVPAPAPSVTLPVECGSQAQP